MLKDGHVAIPHTNQAFERFPSRLLIVSTANRGHDIDLDQSLGHPTGE